MMNLVFSGCSLCPQPLAASSSPQEIRKSHSHVENILGTDWMVFSRRRWKVVSSGDLEKKKQQRGPDRQWSHIVGTMMGGGVVG